MVLPSKNLRLVPPSNTPEVSVTLVFISIGPSIVAPAALFRVRLARLPSAGIRIAPKTVLGPFTTKLEVEIAFRFAIVPSKALLIVSTLLPIAKSPSVNVSLPLTSKFAVIFTPKLRLMVRSPSKLILLWRSSAAAPPSFNVRFEVLLDVKVLAGVIEISPPKVKD